MTTAAGLFAIGLVLGWAALFGLAPGWPAALARALATGAVVFLGALSPEPRAAVAGLGAGALAHLLLRRGVRERAA